MYRTDLAIERKEIIEEKEGEITEIPGITIEKCDYGKDVKSTVITIENEEAASKMKKPIGKYITIETKGVLEENAEDKQHIIYAVAEELKRLIKFHYHLKVMVAGLGNREVTPDSLGPATASKLKVTGHMFKIFGADGDDEMANVTCITPGVTAATGMESAEIIKKTMELCCPEVIIVIDSLAARKIERVNTTIQITDTGISPGSGMGNDRTGINKKTIGVKVIAIGVPTVIDATTIIRDALEENCTAAQEIESYIDEFDEQMIVTSTDIDMLIKEFSDIISSGINICLHPGIYS